MIPLINFRHYYLIMSINTKALCFFKTFFALWVLPKPVCTYSTTSWYYIVLYYPYYTVLYMYSVDTLPYSTCIVLPNRYHTVLHSTVLYMYSLDTLPYSTCIYVFPNRYHTVLHLPHCTVHVQCRHTSL